MDVAFIPTGPAEDYAFLTGFPEPEYAFALAEKLFIESQVIGRSCELHVDER
jgi:hypothetical protein